MRMVLNRRGLGVLPMVLGLSVASVITATIISQMSLDAFRKAAAGYSEWETNLANQKALSIGAFLVAHNMILCREGGWVENANRDQKCRWGGARLTKPVEPSAFDITSQRYNEKNEYELNLVNRNPEGGKIDTRLTVKLVKWSDDESLRNIVGEIPLHSAFSDDDEFMVLMTASSDLQLGEDKRKTITKLGAIRRPMPTPNLQVITTGRETCIFECASGGTLTPNPECRGALLAPDGGDTEVSVRIKNLGPGALFGLKYERITSFSQDSFPGRANESDEVNVMGDSEAFLPGEVYDAKLVRKCYTPTAVRNTASVDQITARDANGNVTNVVVTSSLRNLSRESFDLSVSKFDPIAAVKDPQFQEKYNPRDTSTFVKNPTRSSIEPKRLGVELTDVVVDSPRETVTTTTLVVRERAESFTPSGDGDGDGDN